MGKYASKHNGRGTRDVQAFAILGLISLAISVLAWSATPGAGV